MVDAFPFAKGDVMCVVGVSFDGAVEFSEPWYKGLDVGVLVIVWCAVDM